MKRFSKFITQCLIALLVAGGIYSATLGSAVASWIMNPYRFATSVDYCDPSNYTNVHSFHYVHPDHYTLNGGDISQLDDLSGNGNHAVQATASLQTTLVSSDPDFNGEDSMSIDSAAGNELLAAFHAATTQPFTVIAVNTRAGTGGGGFGRLFAKEAGSTPMLNNSNSTQIAMSAGSQLTYTIGAAPNSAWIYSGLFNGASSEFWADGVSKVTGNVGTGNYTTAGWTIGGSATSRSWDGKIAFIALLNEDPSNADHNNLGSSCLATRYGLTWTDIV